MGGITLYDAYVPNVFQLLDCVDDVLTKAENYAKEKGIDANAEYLGARLYEDMKPLTFQIHILARLAKASITSMTGAAAEDWESEESLQSFDALHAHVEKTRALFKSLKPEQFNGRENDDVEVKLGPAHFTVKAQASLLQITQPNLYFHVVTIYDILRSKGVPVGKRDYLTPFAKDVVPWSRPSSVDKP